MRASAFLPRAPSADIGKISHGMICNLLRSWRIPMGELYISFTDRNRAKEVADCNGLYLHLDQTKLE